jgi:XTP/dITP diphosphohydrolase
VGARNSSGDARKISRVFLASSNEGKLREFRRLAGDSPIQFDLLPDFRSLSAVDESAPTFAENGAGKALYYSQFTEETVLADDSGLVVPALDGAPGVQSARYAGPGATDADRVQKLLGAMQSFTGNDRCAHFVCVISLAQRGRALAIVSDMAPGVLTLAPQGTHGFGYDPVFFSPELGRTFAEAIGEEKDRLSHRGKAFRKVLAFLEGSKIL